MLYGKSPLLDRNPRIQNIKRKATSAVEDETVPRKKSRISDHHQESPVTTPSNKKSKPSNRSQLNSCSEQSQRTLTQEEATSEEEDSLVVSTDNMTSVERTTGSGRRLKIICYRSLNEGKIDKYGVPTTQSPKVKSSPSSLRERSLPEKNAGRKPQRNIKEESNSDSSPVRASDSTPAKNKISKDRTSSLKKMGKVRGLKDTEISDLLGSDSEIEEVEGGLSGSGEEDLESEHTLEKQRAESKLAQDKTESCSRLHPQNNLTETPTKNMRDLTLPLPECKTPREVKKTKEDKVKSKSTVKKRFKCGECGETFTTRTELSDHKEDHDDFKPLPSTPGGR